MKPPVKFRPHIEKIWRPKPEAETRLGKVRLDKNERISPFPESFWRDFLQAMTQEVAQACPEVYPLYERIAAQNGLAMENILLTAGSDAAIRHCFETFVSPGEKVFYPEPTFAMVSVYGALCGAGMMPVTYDSNLRLDIEYLINGLDENTSLIVLANPNSPTGTHVSNDVIVSILEKAARLRIPMLIDEAYYGFCPYTTASLMKEFPNLVITRSLSKIAGVAGLRVGYAMGHAAVISLLTRFRPMYEVNSAGIVFACKILDNWDVAETYGRQSIEGRERFASFLKGRGFSVVDTEANFLHVDFGSVKDDVLKAFGEEGILVRGMLNIPGYENYTRLSVGPWESMIPVVNAIRAVLNESDV